MDDYQEIELPDIDAVTEFVGYDIYEVEATILYVKENLIVFDKTPFFVETDEQEGDQGELKVEDYDYDFMIIDVNKKGNAIFHNVMVLSDKYDICDFCKVGQKATIKIDF